MRYFVVLLMLGVTLCAGRGVDVSSQWNWPLVTNYTVHYYNQKVDHFSYGTQGVTFMQKYLVNRDHWNSTNGPIFFYAGNEGSIELFAQNTGFMFEIAPTFGALLVFAEHRYYGASLPFGKKAYSHKQYYQYQSSMQALADYAALLTDLKKTTNGAENSPIIVFGGSYGGMLAAWMRIKYPNVVQGAIAASAPVAQFTGLTPCNKFGEVVTNVFHNTSTECEHIIRSSWAAINTLTATAQGRDWLSKSWKLCKPLNTSADVHALKDYLTNVWTNLAMADYPYMANFLAPLPAYPVMAVCQPMKMIKSDDKSILNQLFNGLSVYFNYTTTATCLAYQSSMPDTLDDNGWNLQSCTEMVMPFCYDNKKDFFEAQPWNFNEFEAQCLKKWGLRPQPYKMELIYGGRDLHGASNIVFSNGLLDPWSTGGVMENISDSVVSVIIPEGAHHLDLRGSQHADPQSVIAARIVHMSHIQKWIDQYHQQRAAKLH